MNEWKLVPTEPTAEMLAATHCHANEVGGKSALLNWRSMVAAAPLLPHETLTLEEARSDQHWKGMDGACAWHLIERHAECWGEVATMMTAWLDANRNTTIVEQQGQQKDKSE